MQKAGQGFYTIGSSGHEGMAAVARALRPDDIAFLHYRDAAFQIARADQVPGQTITWDMLLSFACSSDDPISGGRHKVLGSKALMIPPQTSTIASHLPKAVGAAFSLGLARRNAPEHRTLPKMASRCAVSVMPLPTILQRKVRLTLRLDISSIDAFTVVVCVRGQRVSGFLPKHLTGGSPHR